MKKIIIIIVTILSTAIHSNKTAAQSFSGIQWDWYDIAARTAIATGNKNIAPDSCAALQIGKDTTNYGLLLPRVIDTSITGQKKGLLIYRHLDSSIYYHNGVKWQRLGTGSGSGNCLCDIDEEYIDSIYLALQEWISEQGYLDHIDEGWAINVEDDTVHADSTTLDNRYAKNNGNTFGNTFSIGSNDNFPFDFKTNNTVRGRWHTSGNLSVGSTTDAGYRFDVTGNTNGSRVSATHTSNSGIENTFSISGVSNQTTSAGWNALDINFIDAGTGGGNKYLINARMGVLPRFRVTEFGRAEAISLGNISSPDYGTINFNLSSIRITRNMPDAYPVLTVGNTNISSTGDALRVGGYYDIGLVVNHIGQTICGGPIPETSAQLEVKSSTRGFLPPRMPTEQRDLIASPVPGLIIWNNTTERLEVYKSISTGWQGLQMTP